jgi:ubiquinone/menaquinone biosynthesis C-methylase UbiE
MKVTKHKMMTNIKETYWSRFAGDYEKRQAFVAGDDLIRIMMDRLRNETNLRYVLELGCGTGLFTEIICQNAKTVTATDFSDEMIIKARELRQSLPNVRFSKEDATNLSFEEQSFDTVFMANLVHIIADPDKVITESLRVLKPGGRIIITSFAIDAMSFFNKIKMASRYVKIFGRVSEESRKVKINPKVVEQMLIKKNVSMLNNELLGNATRAMFIVAKKIN